ncbi:hypothetical protein [Nonomuraea sp. SYSU D8015]|uniref:hypothetical protein n=1 Tax=Nonomuraea sp. SYSU D8015 TaxID=2593644 RepID=UPI0016610350|nr:hypothetical protein [Nonomuraea sp. SYSU D8015]
MTGVLAGVTACAPNGGQTAPSVSRPLILGVLFLGVLFLGVLFLGVLFLGVLFLGVLFLGVLFLGVLFLGVLFLGALFLGVLFLGVLPTIARSMPISPMARDGVRRRRGRLGSPGGRPRTTDSLGHVLRNAASAQRNVLTMEPSSPERRGQNSSDLGIRSFRTAFGVPMWGV